MKKLLFLGALAAMLLGTASCSNDMEPAMTDDGTVQFTIELPGNVDSRAIADGLTANKLTVAVYDETGAELTQLQVNKDIHHQTTVEFKLVKGQKYSFAFWAQAEGAPYTFTTATKTVTVNYENAKSNDEKRDAFYAYRADLTVTGPMTETIYLYRPFCQLNYGASDLADAIKAGVNVTKSAVTVNHAATSFNLATGETAGDQAVTFTKEVLPNDPAKLTVEETQYDWMAMNYFLVPGNQATIETSLQLYEGDAETAVRDITVDNVPVQKNHRTNIVGNLFTEDVNFNVIIDERFDQPDYIIINGVLCQPVSAADLATTTFNADNNYFIYGEGETVTLDAQKIIAGKNVFVKDITIEGKPLYVTAENITFNNVNFDNAHEGQESSLYVTTTNTKNIAFYGCSFTNAKWDNIQLTNQNIESVVFENCNFKNTEQGYRYIHLEIRNSAGGYATTNGTVTVKNCVFENVNSQYCKDSAVTITGFFFANQDIENNIVKGAGADNITHVEFWIRDGRGPLMEDEVVRQKFVYTAD